MPIRRKSHRPRRLLLESLEPRIVLDGGPLITEFVAINDSTKADVDGEFEDWIEIHNPTSDPIPLDGWYLTDNANNLDKWQFPDITLAPGEYRVVFASNKVPTNPTEELHTNFKLAGDGEDLALVKPDGLTVAHAFLDYPQQVADLSYGILVPDPYFDQLVAAGADARYHVPTDGEDISSWTAPSYDDSSWSDLGPTGIGFTNNQPAMEALIGTDVQDAMLGENASLWIRIEFTSGDPLPWDRLNLRMNYDDGFVAYLNGAEMARRNAPDELAFDSAATAEHPNGEAIVFEEIDASDALGSLNAGTNVLAIHGLNAVAANTDFLIRPELTVNAYLQDPFYMAEATPGAENSEGVQEVVADTKFSLDRGFYETPESVEITTDTVGATIKFTTDGSAPGLTHGGVYTGPITVDTTTTLRAMAFKPGALPTNIDTLTYIFLDDVIRQTGAGYPQDWGGGTTGDYQMAPDVVNDARYADRIKGDLQAIPTMSIVTDIDNLFSSSTGIYYNPTSRGAAWERPVSVEMIAPDGSTGRTEFQIDAGLRVHGGAGRGRGNAKHSLRLLFKDEYGASKLDYPLFADDDPNAVESFDTIVLRAGFNDQWRGVGATYLQDPWVAKNQNLNGGYAPHGTWVHLYLNGLYWGLYNPVERNGASKSASYFGGEKEDYDAYHTNQLKDGTSTRWNELHAAVQANPIDYAAVQEMLDIPGYIDYMIFNQFGGNGDWPHNNWDATVYRDGGKWRFHSWDAEFSLENVNHNIVNRDYGTARNAGGILKALHKVPEFRMTYADRIHRLMFNDGLLTPDTAIATLNGLEDKIDRAIVGESARWGDGSYSARSHSETHDDWRNRIDYLRDTYFPARTNIVLNQFRNSTTYPGLYPDVVAPTFSEHDDDVLLPDDVLTVSAPAGTIYYMTDGSDPRLDGGGIHPDAIAAASGHEIPLLQSATVKSRVLEGGEWSALNETFFTVTLEGVVLNIDGVPSTGGQLEAGQALSMTAPEGTIPEGTIPEGTIYYTLDGTDPRQPDGSILPSALTVAWDTPIPVTQSVSVMIRAYLDGVWSPPNQAVFLVDTPSGPHQLVISEINYHPLDATPAELAVNPGLTGSDFEYLELQYQGVDPLNLSGIQFVDGVTFDFGDSSPITLQPGDYVLVVANQQAYEARYGIGGVTIAGQFDGNLDNAGEGLTLAGPFGETLLDFSYGDGGKWPGRADGRGASLELIDPIAVPSGVPESNPLRTAYLEDGDHWRGSEFGGSPGSVGTPRYVDVIVNEVLSHTDLPQSDSIELYNTTGARIDISGWYLSDSWGAASNPETGDYKKFRIPNGTFIEAYDYVYFDEDDFNPTLGTDPGDFSLNGAHGDDVWLLQADASGNLVRFAEHVEFGAAVNGESFGRWPDGSGDLHPMVSRTLGEVNSGPRVGEVIISEVMYHPAPPTATDLEIYPGLTESDLEYIEIYNPTGDLVPLANWRLRGDVDFDFPPTAYVLGGETRIVLSFDPAVDQVRMIAFLNHYELHPFTVLTGGYQGSLDNAGDRVRLLRPDDPPLDEPEFIPHLWEDQVNYDDDSPWPVMADGTGKSLSRYFPAGWGDAASSWTDTVASPGSYVAAVDTLDVLGVTPTPDGFVVQFDRAVDASELNLYDELGGELGSSDVTLVGAATGPVSGSLSISGDSVTFLSAGDLLASDTYTLTLRGAANGFRGTSGQQLAGDTSFTPGSDYVGAFEIISSPELFVGLPDFARGPSQPVKIPAMDSGLPLMLTDNRVGGPGVESVDVTLTYDPALLSVTGAGLGEDVPEGTTLLSVDTGTPGQVIVSLATPVGTPLPPGAIELLTFTASVPPGASLGATQMLALADVALRDTSGTPIEAAADNAYQAVSHFGDATGNGAYSGLDAQRTARVAVGLDSGFAAHPLVAPELIADISGNGEISGFDAQRIALAAAGLPVDRIPSLPAPQRLSLPAPSSPSRQSLEQLGVQSYEPQSIIGEQVSMITDPLLVVSDRVSLPASRTPHPESRILHPASHTLNSDFRSPHSPDFPLPGDRHFDDPWRLTVNEFDDFSKAAKMEGNGEIGVWTSRLIDEVFALGLTKRAT